ncbi:hypothetical protein [Parasutterella excrementihominis]|uniref:hypothetical protein n=1 Tax=Parasutterella excrementihominis TaxID=487175 RepID=UPI00243021CF|nr:hypothetical protein [Parasutterella excrementihominis]
MFSTKKDSTEKVALFSLSPLVISLFLAVSPQVVSAQTAIYEYAGKWVADDFDPSMPPFLQGSIIQKNSSGAVLSEKDFSYAEDWNGNVTSPYGFREGQDWSFLWLGSTFEEWYSNPVNKSVADRYGLSATNTVTPNSMNLEGPLIRN